MMHARERPDGSLYEFGARPATYPDDVPVKGHELRPPTRRCGDECKADHTRARCVVPHAALIAVLDESRAKEAAIAAELRAMAEERLKAKGWPPGR